jgi:hypothetical protein
VRSAPRGTKNAIRLRSYGVTRRKNYFALNYFAEKISGSKKRPSKGALALKMKCERGMNRRSFVFGGDLTFFAEIKATQNRFRLKKVPILGKCVF